MSLLANTNLFFSLLTVIGQVIIGLLIAALLLFPKSAFLLFVKKNAILFSFIVAFIATVGSLFYSEVIGLEPCKLCWFQRIFMYPQTILLLIALWKKQNGLAILNGLGLSIIGGIIAGYHYLLQVGIAPSVSCKAVGYSVSCAKVFAMNFGYITIPMMSLTAFLLIIIFMITARSK